MQVHDHPMQSAEYPADSVWPIIVAALGGCAQIGCFVAEYQNRDMLAGIYFGVAFLLYTVSMIGFCRFVRRTYRMMLRQARPFPSWWIWMMMVPVIGYVFSWMLLPFKLPGAFKRYGGDDTRAVTGKLLVIGLFMLIILPILAERSRYIILTPAVSVMSVVVNFVIPFVLGLCALWLYFRAMIRLRQLLENTPRR